jgi:hypothetical protein
MGLGTTEILILGSAVVLFALAFALGFFAGKSSGMREGLRLGREHR